MYNYIYRVCLCVNECLCVRVQPTVVTTQDVLTTTKVDLPLLTIIYIL